MSEGKLHSPETFSIRERSYAARVANLESEHKEVLKLPKGIPLIIRDKNDVRKLFMVSSVVWHEMYSPKRVKKIVSGLAEGKYSKKEKKEIIKELNKIRKFGQIHRASGNLFDESHQPPKVLHKLIVNMGKLKDHPGKEKKYAKKLLKSVKEYNKKMDKIDDSFKQDKAKGFRNHLLMTGNQMRGVLGKGNPKKIELQHHIRKIGTRLYMNLFLLEIIRDNNPYRDGMKQYKNAYFLFNKYDKLIEKNLKDFYKDNKEYKKNRRKNKKGKIKKPILKIDLEENNKLIKALDKLDEQWKDEIKKANKKARKKHKKNKS